MADLTHSDRDDAPVVRGPLFYLGAAGLLIAMCVETVAVLGRHLGWPLLGAIEIIQGAILLTACAAAVIATLAGVHATVHLLMDRLGDRARRWIGILSGVLSVLFFAALTSGSLWLTLDYWHAFEESELLHIPFKPLRLLVAIASISVTAIYAWRTVRPQSSAKQ